MVSFFLGVAYVFNKAPLAPCNWLWSAEPSVPLPVNSL